MASGSAARRAEGSQPDEQLEATARTLLAAAPSPPADVSRFTSNALFGQPGIYPDGPPMVPAAGPPLDDDRVVAELARLVAALGTDATMTHDDPRLVARVPALSLRASCALLAATVAAPALTALVDGDGITALDYGVPSSAGRVIGTTAAAGDGRVRVVNERYRDEHFALVTPSLAHDLLHRVVGAGQAEEAFLHALLAMVHLQLLAADPGLADLRSELARRQHSLAITLVNSRRPGDDRIRLVAPDGPGTIPGGDPALQSPDFWSIPFGKSGPAPDEAPAALSAVLAGLAAPRPADDAPRHFGDELAHWFDEHHSRRWLPVRAQVRASAALGLVDPDPAMRAWAGLADPRD